jgi:predicted RNA binding protein YcfA (HicA-like mRNA interferase family)
MVARLRRLSARELLLALRGVGFETVSVRGSHAKLCRVAPDGTRQILTVPLHAELASGTLRAIARQASRFIGQEAAGRLFFTGSR